MNQYKGRLYLIGAFALAGTSVISARFVTDVLGVFTITAVSLFFAIIFLSLLVRKQLIRYWKQMSYKRFLFLTLQAICGIFLFRFLLITGLNFTSAGEAGILTGATPAITALLAVAVLKEKANNRKLGGILCTMVGILIMQGFFTLGNGLSLKHIGGNILVLCAAASESSFNILSRAFVVKDREEEISPITQTIMVSLIAFILCLIPALLEHPIDRLSHINLTQWVALLWYGIFVTGMAFICWYYGIMKSGAFTAAAFSGIMPLTSLLLSVFVLGEHIDYKQWMGGLFVISGMIFIGTEKSLNNS